MEVEESSPNSLDTSGGSDDYLKLLSLSKSPQSSDEDSSPGDAGFDFNKRLAKTIRSKLSIAKKKNKTTREATSNESLVMFEQIEQEQGRKDQSAVSDPIQSPEPISSDDDNGPVELFEPNTNKSSSTMDWVVGLGKDHDNENRNPMRSNHYKRTVDIEELRSEVSVCTHSGNIQDVESMEEEVADDIETEDLYKRVEIVKVGSLCFIALKHPIKIHIKGKAKVKSIAGSVKIFGHVLEGDRTYDILAVKYNHCLVLETIENKVTNSNLFIKLTEMGMSMLDARNLNVRIEKNDAIICLEELSSRKIDFMEQVFNKGDIFINVKSDDTVFSPTVLGMSCSLYVNNPPKKFNFNPEWENLFNSEQSDLKKVLICGGKNFGKSTLLRYHVNTMLNKVNKVLVLDLDPGQCEFTVAGNISATVVDEPLFGPNFTHLKRPDYTLHLGMINVADCLRRYVNGVAKLVNHCSSHEEYLNMPWVVNTMGMTTDMGVRLITYIITCLKPTTVVQLDDKVNKKGFYKSLKAKTVEKFYKSYRENDVLFENTQLPNLNYKFILYEQCPDNKTGLAAHERRLLNYIAYFGELLDANTTVGFLGITPYEVSIGDLCVVTDMPLGERDAAKVLNGKIVALCISDEVRGKQSEKTITLREEALVCVGFGLVRAVDVNAGRAFMVTPVPRSLLCGVNAIVYADWTPELNVCPPLGVFVPYRMPTPDDAHMLMPARRRFNPLQLMRATSN